MIDALYIASSGLRSQQEQIDVISNNVANMQTPGFKRGRVNFSEVAHAPVAGEVINTLAQGHGGGARVLSTTMEFAGGALQPTRGALDLAIDGHGFFELEDASGALLYTRAGQFHLDQEGYVVSANGLRLSAGIQIPPGATEVQVSPGGEFSAELDGSKERTVLGSLSLVTFASSDGLVARGENLFAATTRSGDPTTAVPAQDGAGRVQQGYLEMANVDMIDEMTALVLAQRAYQLNARVLQASDQVLETINNLRR